MKRLATTIALLALMLVTNNLLSQDSCSATNEKNDKRCSVSCSQGQTASCTDVSDSNDPTCYCTGVPSTPSAVGTRFALKNGKVFEPVTDHQEEVPVETTDVVSVIDQKLSQLPDHHLRQECHPVQSGTYCLPPPCCGRQPHLAPLGCVPTYTNVCQQVYGKLTVQPPLIVVSGPTVTLGNVNWNDIPSDFFPGRGIYTNCQSLVQDEQFSHTEAMMIGDTVTKTKTLSTGSSQSSSISGSIKIGPINVGDQQTLTISTQSSITDSNAENHTKSTSETVTVPWHIAAMTESTIQHTIILYHVPVPFTGTVAVDGQISQNLDGIHLLSQLLPSESDRTFDFAGTIGDATLMGTAVKTTEKKLTAADCQKANLKGKTAYKMQYNFQP